MSGLAMESVRSVNRIPKLMHDCPSYINSYLNYNSQLQSQLSSPLSSSSLPMIEIIDSDETDNKTNDSYFKSITNFHIMDDKFHREDERLKTFERWPLDWMDKNQLAQTGMFFTGDEDKVKCYFCEVEIGRWEREDQPVPEHLRWSPNCPLLKRRTTNNVPINAEELDRILPPTSYDICGANDSFETRPSSLNESAISNQTMATTSQSSTSPNNNNCRYLMEFPEYAIEGARIRSFAEWPRSANQTPAQMAEAGFFYSGLGDRVKCFSCGGGLKDWDDSDEPWEQHALWLPKCRFLKFMKGQNFIDAVALKHKSLLQATTTTCANASTSTSEIEDELLKGTPLTIQCCSSNSNSSSSTSSTTSTSSSSSSTNSNDNMIASSSLSPMLNSCSQEVALAVAGTSPSEIMPTAAIYCDNINSSKNCENGSISNNVNNIANTTTSTSTTTNTTSTATTNNCVPEERLCKICYANEYNTTFLPCGHVVACAKCASSVTKCPMCRKPFTDVMRVYFS